MSNYSYDDILSALSLSGISKGDIVFFTTSLGMLGIPPRDVDNSEALNSLFLNAFREAVGSFGAVLVPTYSYTFGNSTQDLLAVYDPLITPSSIGAFPNFVLKANGVQRTLDPMVSVAGIGPDCDHLFADLPATSYGEGCLFSRLVSDPRVKCCSVGLGTNWTPFIHYADWLNQVPFRYDKRFYGVIVQEGRLLESDWIYSVRTPSPNSLADAYRVGNEAAKAGIWKSAELGRAKVYSASMSKYFQFVMSYLLQDKWALAKGPHINAYLEEEKRVQKPQFNGFSIAEFIENKGNFPNGNGVALVSSEADWIMDKLCRELDLKLCSIQTGKWIDDFLVPEKWTLKKSSVRGSQGHDLIATHKIQLLPYATSLTARIGKRELIDRSHGLRHYDYEHIRGCFFKEINPGALEKASDSFYDVEIESLYSFGEMYFCESKSDDGIFKKAIVCSVNNFDDDILGFKVLIDFFTEWRTLETFRNIKVVFTTGYLGYLAWKKNECFIDEGHILLLNFRRHVSQKIKHQALDAELAYADAIRTFIC